MSAAKEPGPSGDLFFDWNVAAGDPATDLRPVELYDESLRDGIQSPSVRDPDIEEKKTILRLMDRLGIHWADIGLPGAGPRAVADVTALAATIRDEQLRIRASCAARTLVRDIEPIAQISEDLGMPVEVMAFIGSSPIRQAVEGWDIEMMRRCVEESIDFATRHDLPACLVTEDTTRARPETIEDLYLRAIDRGAYRICLCDTAGHATPEGARRLVEWARAMVARRGAEVLVDWHGHNDRGLSIPVTFAAHAAGADRIHGCGLGIGERVGNTPMDQLLVNLRLMGLIDQDLTALMDYCQAISAACEVPIPYNYPVVGKDAFRTATGVHAAAVIKGEKKGDRRLADVVYSGVPAGMVGREQEIDISHMSGMSNVVYWLTRRHLPADPETCQAVLDLAKRGNRVLTEAEIRAVLDSRAEVRSGH
ncbi:MAG: LeuA family protein [Acidobacteriota bacterium]